MDLHNDVSFTKLMVNSYHRLTGRMLTPAGLTPEQEAQWLYVDAPFGLLAHNTAADPIFVYGNQTAQRLFGYTWEELTKLPSRLSAEAPDRDERQRFLEEVAAKGFVDGYKGIRVRKSGERFLIADATVWQLIDEDGEYRGQAAMLPLHSDASGPGTESKSFPESVASPQVD